MSLDEPATEALLSGGAIAALPGARRSTEGAAGEPSYDVAMTEMPLPPDDQLAEVVREAAASGQVVYLTDKGQRLAAIVPAALAELLERGETTNGRRVLGARGAGRSGRQDISERMEEILANEVAS